MREEQPDYRHDPPLTPALAIRAKCRECVCNEHGQIDNCTATLNDGPPASQCKLWPYRHGHGRDDSQGKPGTRLQQIHRECRRCMGNSYESIKTCPSHSCALWPHRLPGGICQDPEGEAITPRRKVSEAQKRQFLSTIVAQKRRTASTEGECALEQSKSLDLIETESGDA